jgi:hypothetical protein
MIVPAAGPARALRGRETASSTGAAEPRDRRNARTPSGKYILVEIF